MKLCKSCALKVHMNERDADLSYRPGLYLPGAKAPELCEGCAQVALCLEIDADAPNGRCQDCGGPKESNFWGRCEACQKIDSKAAAAKFDTAVGPVGPEIRKEIAEWARKQAAALKGDR